MPSLIHISIAPVFRAGDPPPSGYNDWHEWAEVQIAAGLEQRRCWKCGLWRFPQEKCCGPEQAYPDTGFTVDDVISGRKVLTGKLGEKASRILAKHRKREEHKEPS